MAKKTGSVDGSRPPQRYVTAHTGVLIFDARHDVAGKNEAAARLLVPFIPESLPDNIDDAVGRFDAFPCSDLYLKNENSTCTVGQEQIRVEKNVVPITGGPLKDGHVVLLRKINAPRPMSHRKRKPAARPLPTAGTNRLIFPVSEQKNALEALQQSERRWRNLIEQASDGIFLTRRDGTFVEVNTAACRMTGYAYHELLGMNSREVVTAENLRLFPIRSGVIRKEESLLFERELKRKDGSILPIEVNMKVIEDDLVQTIARDLTDRKKHEQDLIRAKERAEEMARLKSVFLANMSHEIRTPLASVIGFADILLDEVTDQGREFVQLIRNSGTRLMETLNSVLDLAQLESQAMKLHPTLIDLDRVIQEDLELFQTRARLAGLNLRYIQPADGPVAAILDRAAFSRIFNNLVSNALKFTPAGAITIGLDHSADTVCLSVSDTGIGIEPACLDRIFNEFEQESTGASREYNGAGLGLYITRRLLHLMGGTITVRSEKNTGSTFTVVLPRKG